MSTGFSFLFNHRLGSLLPLNAQQAASIVVNASQALAPVNAVGDLRWAQGKAHHSYAANHAETETFVVRTVFM
jgi:hypothetical protein